MIDGVSPELCAAYDVDCTNYDLLGVMADQAEENGYPAVAEAMRWLWSNRKVPAHLRNAYAQWFGWHSVSYSIATGSAELPVVLHKRMPDFKDGDRPTDALRRFVTGWPSMSMDELELHYLTLKTKAESNT